MRLRWFWRMLVYLVGGILTAHGTDGGSQGKFLCSDVICKKVFHSRSGRDKHVRRTHGSHARIPCTHGCGKDYVERSDSLRYHERTCDMNPDGNYRVGEVIAQQQHHQHNTATTTTNSGRSTRMDLIQSSHAGKFRLYPQPAGCKNQY